MKLTGGAIHLADYPNGEPSPKFPTIVLSAEDRVLVLRDPVPDCGAPRFKRRSAVMNDPSQKARSGSVIHVAKSTRRSTGGTGRRQVR